VTLGRYLTVVRSGKISIWVSGVLEVSELSLKARAVRNQTYFRVVTPKATLN
jgi:hypothetical protein